MASPTLDLLCCTFYRITNETINASEIGPGARIHTDFKQKMKMYFYLYHATVIITSTVSVLGAIYWLYPKRTRSVAIDGGSRLTQTEVRQKWILFWLSFADIMACVGLIILSSVSLDTLAESYNIENTFSTSGWEWLCIIATAWIQFFFLATYMWTTCYAVDVYLCLRKQELKSINVYFFISWIFPMVFLTLGLVSLYETIKPQLACSASSGNALLRVYYLFLFIPLVIVLIINPTLYILSSRKVNPLMRAGAMYTDRERKIVRRVRKKFLKIVIVLVICWLPNLINGIMLLSGVPLTTHVHGEKELYTAMYPVLWFIMAILNPLQALLNALVYWGPTGCSFLVTPSSVDDMDDPTTDYGQSRSTSYSQWRSAAVPSDSETAPLVRGRMRETVN